MTRSRSNSRKRFPIRRLAATAVVSFLDPGSAFAQTPPPQIIANYQGLDGRADFAFKFKGESYTRPVGVLKWVIPEDQITTAGLPRSFTAFCAEPLVGVAAGNTYKFDLQHPEDPAAYGLPNTEAGQKEARLRGAFIRELFGRYYLSSIDPTNPTPDAARAFQVALWEIAFESQLSPDLEIATTKFNINGGTFQADYPPPGTAPTYVSTAQTYLSSLTGDDSLFYGPGLAGAELVRLNGLPNAAGVVAQDQYALRTIPGNAGTVPGTAALGGALSSLGGGLGLGGSGLGSGLIGPPLVAGVGGGGAGPGIATGTGEGTSPTSPTTSTTGTSTSPPVTTTSPPASPPGTTSPPGSPPPPNHNTVPPTNPVPGPAGAVLGGIAAMVFAGRRGLKRVFRPNA